ncbi:MAG: hypothetical protein LQ343_003064 [Gyalolechia ehrenbergii]|nr:MAG: hypothetical protein LQ343_003064 [Gyalolechia ehrenbergii]
MGRRQPLVLPPYYQGNGPVVTFNPCLRRLQRGELIFLVWLRKLHHQSFHTITLAIQRVRRQYQRVLVSNTGGRPAGILPTELYLPSDGEVETRHYFLGESANMVGTYGIQCGHDLVETAAVFHYWELLWRCDQTPGKSRFWENWRGTRDAYYNLIGTYLYEQGLADWLRQQSSPSFGPMPFERVLGPFLHALHLNPYMTNIPTTAYQMSGPLFITPCHVTPVVPLDRSFSPQE